jgi:hypothetical protein
VRLSVKTLPERLLIEGMRVAIHQPQYLPWVPYLAKADACDVFVYLDNVQFQRRGVQNRNQIKTVNGALWLTVPVNAGREDKIQDVRIADNPWQTSHIRSLQSNYARAPFFNDLGRELLSILRQKWTHLVDLNIAVTEWMFERLGIGCRRVRASTLDASGTKDDLMISLCKAAGGTVYLSGPGARVYQDLEKFWQQGIELQYQVYENQPYTQCFPEIGFVADLSAVDLVLNMGPKARDILIAGRKDTE